MDTKQKKVLIALDYDPTAQKIAEEGYALAQNINAGVTLIHVVLDHTSYTMLSHVKIMGFAGEKDISEQRTQTKDGPGIVAKAFLGKSKNHLGDKAIQLLVKEGDPAKSILEAASEIKADVIVMGSHSKRWLEKIVMGSVTEKVLSLTTIPLFIIPTKNLT